MFTGLIESVGTIKSIVSKGNYRVITVVPDPPFKQITKGESIAVSGPCLTVISFGEESFTVEASQESIRLTTLKNLRVGNRVNIERALRADSRLGGHFVSGHIDDTLKVKRVQRVGNSLQVTIDLPEKYSVYVVDKGSVAVDGISLTVIQVDKNSFTLNLIPETQARTTWLNIRVGDEINVEFDLIGKYLLRFLQQRKEGSRLTIDFMQQMGY
jgi:riboflavin synthase